MVGFLDASATDILPSAVDCPTMEEQCSLGPAVQKVIYDASRLRAITERKRELLLVGLANFHYMDGNARIVTARSTLE